MDGGLLQVIVWEFWLLDLSAIKLAWTVFWPKERLPSLGSQTTAGQSSPPQGRSRCAGGMKSSCKMISINVQTSSDSWSAKTAVVWNFFELHHLQCRRRGSCTSYKNDIRMIEMDVVDLIFGRLGVYLRHVLLHGAMGHVAVLVGSPWQKGSVVNHLYFASQVELFSTGNVDLRHQLDFDARQFVALLQLLGPIGFGPGICWHDRPV